MKNTLLFLCYLICSSLTAQITITDNTFPVLGDTLRTVDDFNANIFNIADDSPNQTWDFSGLSGVTINETVYQDPSEGTAVVAGADVLVTGIAGESYFAVNGNEFQLIAAKGSDPVGFGIETLITFDPAIVERVAPLELGDTWTNESNAGFPFSSDVVPDSLLSSLPVIPDSFRVRINQTIDAEVDTYGSMEIPGATYAVLREKLTITRSTRIDALFPFLGWTDVTDLITGIIGVDVGLGEITTKNYRFHNDDVKEFVANVTTDENDNVLQVAFRYEGILSSTDNVLSDAAINIFPNPAIDVLNIEAAGLSNEIHTISMIDFSGKTILVQSIKDTDGDNIAIDINGLSNGIYLLQIVGSFGDILTTEKVVVQK